MLNANFTIACFGTGVAFFEDGFPAGKRKRYPPASGLCKIFFGKRGHGMKEIKKILFPVDFSEVSKKIVPYVETMADKFNSEIHLLFVARILDYFVSIYVPHSSINAFEEEILKGGKKSMEQFINEHFPTNRKILSEVVLGDASERILEYVKKANIDLVIMGTHGRKGLDKVLFGSVAERVSKMSAVPVLLVNPYRAN
jgi:nucleotide-binding universal stress UspA family protein